MQLIRPIRRRVFRYTGYRNYFLRCCDSLSGGGSIYTMEAGGLEVSFDIMRDFIKAQFDISWRLLEYHLNGLDDEECLWTPSSKGLHIDPTSGAVDWPDSEGYDIGLPNVAWLLWHISFWWSMVFDYSFAAGTLRKEDIKWVGVMDAKANIVRFRNEWINKLDTMSYEEFSSNSCTKWPFEKKPFYDLAAWLNLELMKNASEIGYCRFLYANRSL